MCTRAGRWIVALAATLAGTLPSAVLAVNSGRVEYYHRDALGHVRVVSDENGQVLERHDYLPFGEECTSGACAANPGVASGQPRRFTGKERDPESGLDYFGARYYAQHVGRFTTIDPVFTWRANLIDPQRWNRYAYGRNNPLRYVDPDGEDVFDVAGGAITKGHIDLQGKGHFDKATGQAISTPHVQTRPKHVGPGGQVNLGPQATRPATKADVRTAGKLAERKQ